jgi:hypothetical protein
MNFLHGRRVAALLLIVLLPACDEPSAPTRQTVTDLFGVWKGTDATLGGFSQMVIWTISQSGSTIAGTWNNGTVPAGTAITGQVQGDFDKAAQRLTISMTWMPSSPNPYWVCAGFHQDPLVTSGSGTVSRSGAVTTMSLTYGDWAGCNGNNKALASGQLVLVRQ